MATFQTGQVHCLFTSIHQKDTTFKTIARTTYNRCKAKTYSMFNVCKYSIEVIHQKHNFLGVIEQCITNNNVIFITVLSFYNIF